MSRFSSMSKGKRRAWSLGIVLFFLVMCGMIAWSQWYAIHVNVPAYKKSGGPAAANRDKT